MIPYSFFADSLCFIDVLILTLDKRVHVPFMLSREL